MVLLISFSGKGESNTKFYSLNSKFGISMRETNSIVEDDIGFKWASSKTGILRFTEGNFRIYQLPYRKANVISVQLIYDKNTLIAVTNNGQLFKYNRVYDQFEIIIDIGAELNTNFISINSFLIESPVSFWIGTSIGLMKYQNEKGEYRAFAFYLFDVLHAAFPE